MKYDDDVFEGGWPRAHVEILAYAAYNNSKFRLRHWIFKVPPIICCVRGGGAGVYNITLHFRHWPPPSKSNHARGLGLVVIVVKPSTGITALLLRSRPDPTVVAYSVLILYFTHSRHTGWNPGKRCTRSPTQRNSAECFRRPHVCLYWPFCDPDTSPGAMHFIRSISRFLKIRGKQTCARVS